MKKDVNTLFLRFFGMDDCIQNIQEVTLVTMMTMSLGYGARVYHNHRHYRHHRQESKNQ